MLITILIDPYGEFAHFWFAAREPISQLGDTSIRVHSRCSTKLKLWLLPCHFGLPILQQKTKHKMELILLIMKR